MNRIKVILITILLSGICNLLLAQPSNTQGTWMLQKASERQWFGSKVEEKNYTAPVTKSNSLVPLFNELVFSNGDVFGIPVGEKVQQKVTGNIDGDFFIVTNSNQQPVEYYCILQDENTLTLSAKSSAESNGQEVIVEQTITYTRTK